MIKILFLYSLAAILLSSCGTTTIISSAPQDDIYINQVFKGTGTAKIVRMGPPSKSHIEERKMGRTVGEITAKRNFDVITFLLGCYTYGTGFILCWRYPQTITIPCVVRPAWDDAGKAWTRENSAWKK